MAQYILHISSFGGLVPGASHYRGRVEGPHPESCHGGRVYNAPGHRGKTICDQGHELPGQVRWDVEAAWSQEHHDRWAAVHFEGDGPQQFTSEKDVIDRAMIQFLDGSDGLCEKVDPAQEGDELWYGFVGDASDLTVDELDATDNGYGMMIARCQRG